MKGVYSILKDILLEIENTILNEKKVNKSNLFYQKTFPVKSYLINLDLIFDDAKISACVKSEMKSLLLYYGEEIIDYLESNIGNVPIGALLSRFVLKKEELYRQKLVRVLNYSTNEKDLKKYVLRDYLALGFNFYDALFFVTTHKYKTQLHVHWGMDYSQFYSKKVVEKSVNGKKFGKKVLSFKRL